MVLTFAFAYVFRFEPPFAPNKEVMKQGVIDSFLIAVVGFAVAFSVAKVYSVKHDYTVDGNQVRNPKSIHPKWDSMKNKRLSLCHPYEL